MTILCFTVEFSPHNIALGDHMGDFIAREMIAGKQQGGVFPDSEDSIMHAAKTEKILRRAGSPDDLIAEVGE